MAFLLLSTVYSTALFSVHSMAAILFTSSSDATERFNFGFTNFDLLYIFIYWKQTIAMFNRKRQKLSGHEHKKRREARKQDDASLTTINHFLIPLRNIITNTVVSDLGDSGDAVDLSSDTHDDDFLSVPDELNQLTPGAELSNQEQSRDIIRNVDIIDINFPDYPDDQPDEPVELEQHERQHGSLNNLDPNAPDIAVFNDAGIGRTPWQMI